MYWNVPKDHRKIQLVILTAWTTTQWGVMLSSLMNSVSQLKDTHSERLVFCQHTPVLRS